jgi:hypothetical protein
MRMAGMAEPATFSGLLKKRPILAESLSLDMTVTKMLCTRSVLEGMWELEKKQISSRTEASPFIYVGAYVVGSCAFSSRADNE